MSRVIGEHIPRRTALGDTVSTRILRLEDGRECEDVTIECKKAPLLQLEPDKDAGREWPTRSTKSAFVRP